MKRFASVVVLKKIENNNGGESQWICPTNIRYYYTTTYSSVELVMMIVKTSAVAGRSFRQRRMRSTLRN